MKRDWESYFGKPTRYGVVPIKWVEEKDEHGYSDKVICICPICKQEFIPTNIKCVLNETKKQIRMCVICRNKNNAIESRKERFNIGDILHDNLIIKNIFYKDGRQVATVKCSCGNIFDCFSYSLNSNTHPITMCVDCSYKKRSEQKLKRFEISSGTIYNYVKVLYSGEPKRNNDGHNRATSVCECLLCGNIFTAQNHNLKSGHIKSCGCLKSWLEAQTAKFLVIKEIHFTHGFWIEDILTNNGNPCQMDFQIEDEYNNHICFIECQGEQHYKDGDFGRQQREETDIKKKNYCREHNILLYEIRYDEDVETAVDNILTELKKKGLI